MYAYDVALDVGGSGYAGERTLAYFTPTVRGPEAEMIVRQTTRFSQERYPKEWWFRYSIRRSGLFRITDTQPTGSICHLERPLLEVRYPISIGSKWSDRAGCKGDDTEIRLEASVVRRETVDVRGTAVQTYVIDRIIRRGIEGGDPKPLRETWWFAPSFGIFVKMRTESDPIDIVDHLRALKPSALPAAAPPSGF